MVGVFLYKPLLKRVEAFCIKRRLYMEQIYLIAALWLGLAVFSAIIAHHLRISIALVEICVGVIVANIVSRFFGPDVFGSNLEWLRFLASTFGKGILGACFINDLGTVIALGLLFAPFTYKAVIFIAGTTIVLALFPFITSLLHRVY